MKKLILILFSFILIFAGCKKGEPPVVDFTFTGDNCIASCPVSFTNTTIDGNTFHWDFGDGQSSEDGNPPPHIYTQGDTYHVTLTSTNEKGTSSKTQDVVIQNPTQSQLPIANFTFSGGNCTAPCTVTFTNTSINATSYLWTFDGGATSTLPNPTYNYTSGGIKQVKLKAINNYGNNETTQNVSIGAAPTKVRITKVTVLYFPSDDNGTLWDNNPITGNYLADVFFTISDQSNNVYFSISSNIRAEELCATCSYSWNTNFLHTSLNVPLYVDLYDYDSGTANDPIGWTGSWIWSNYTTYPTSKTITANGISVKLDLSWE